MNHNKYNLKVGDKAILDIDFNNASIIRIVNFTPNKMYATVTIGNKEWETMTNRLTPLKQESSIIKTLRRSMDYAYEKKWYEVYWAFDIHGTILIPNHERGNMDTKFYPYAKEALQLISKRDNIILILHTSSFPEELKHYVELFDKNNIYFKYFNENPEICGDNGSFGNYEKKFYFNILFEDKAGFFPEDWKDIYNVMLKYENQIPPLEWKNPTLRKYDKARSSLLEKTIRETLIDNIDEWLNGSGDDLIASDGVILRANDLKENINKIFNH